MDQLIAVNLAHPREGPPVKGFKRRRCSFCDRPVWTARADRAMLEREPETMLICPICAEVLVKMQREAGTSFAVVGQVPGAELDMIDAGRPDLVTRDKQITNLARFLLGGQRTRRDES